MMRKISVFTLVLSLVLMATSAGVAAELEWEDGVTVRAPEVPFSVRGNLVAQTVFEHVSSDVRESESSFSVQRVRPSVRGTAYHENLSYFLMMENAGTSRLLDFWVDYSGHENLSLRMGQMKVPFNREFLMSITQFLTPNRSLANNRFQFPGGWDAGVMLHGNSLDYENLTYKVGVFDGQGPNASSNTNGLLYSGRLEWAPKGDFTRSDVLVKPTKRAEFVAGIGAFYAPKHAGELNDDSSARNFWGGPELDDETTDVTSYTADFQYRHGPWNFIGSLYDREIQENQSENLLQEGLGYSLQAGRILVDEFLYLGARHSQIRHEDSDGSTVDRERESVLGLNVFQRGTQLQTRLEAGITESRTGGDWNEDRLVRLQQQLAF